MDTYLSTWLRFERPDDEEAEAEANIVRSGDDYYYVEWCLSAVGLIKTVGPHSNYNQAAEWLRREGFEDYTS